ncbi:MAG: CDP-alcohol phosphatidyltransferase family protein, partial [Chloroflexota bacterium]
PAIALLGFSNIKTNKEYFVEQSVKRKEQRTLTDHLRIIFSDSLIWAGTVLNNWGITPNVLTMTGVFGSAIGAVIVGSGNFVLGGFIIMLMGPLDALDGAVARVRGEPEDFGAFVDSVSDRYIEILIYGGLLWYYFTQENLLAVMLIFFAVTGSIMVSYMRARAQSLGFEAKVGILTRVERLLVIGPSILFNYPLVGVMIVAVFSNITAFQRIFHVRQESRNRQ